MRTARSSPYGEEALSGRGVTLTETPQDRDQPPAWTEWLGKVIFSQACVQTSFGGGKNG